MTLAVQHTWIFLHTSDESNRIYPSVLMLPLPAPPSFIYSSGTSKLSPPLMTGLEAMKEMTARSQSVM